MAKSTTTRLHGRLSGGLLSAAGVLLTALVMSACVRMQPPAVSGAEMTDDFLRRSVSEWFGALLCPDGPPAVTWIPAGGFGEADDAVVKAARQWRDVNRRAAGHFRSHGFFSRALIRRDLDTICPLELILATRRSFQAGLGLPLSVGERERLEAAAMIVEHAFLTYAAIAAGNRLSLGHATLGEASGSMKALAVFRKECAGQLPADVARLSFAENESADICGAGLLETVGGDRELATFSGDPRRLFVPAPGNAENTYFTATAADIRRWEQGIRALETAASGETAAGTSWFAMTARMPERMPEPTDKFLLVWGASRPFTVALDGVVVGRVASSTGWSACVKLPLDRAMILPDKDVLVTLQVAGDLRELPVRALAVVAAP